ncbi:hypothetical protein NDU88_000658 [Pleurodeles waltl]|uniref:Uncharacterized protein n=1 Tax=Pleurodeles waltl TaxID=8319 RepID=A0AAV7MHG3_PLEWA|nr:hypothetical protein NDU88_000658 [Pleurodeles waltl]
MTLAEDGLEYNARNTLGFTSDGIESAFCRALRHQLPFRSLFLGYGLAIKPVRVEFIATRSDLFASRLHARGVPPALPSRGNWGIPSTEQA